MLGGGGGGWGQPKTKEVPAELTASTYTFATQLLLHVALLLELSLLLDLHLLLHVHLLVHGHHLLLHIPAKEEKEANIQGI